MNRNRTRRALPAKLVIAATIAASLFSANPGQAFAEKFPQILALRGDDPGIVARQNYLQAIEESVILNRVSKDPGFADLYMEPQFLSITVYSNTDSTSIASDLRDMIPGDVSLKFVKAELSASQSEVLRKYFIALQPILAEAGIKLTSWGIDALEGPFTVDYDKRARALDDLAIRTAANSSSAVQIDPSVKSMADSLIQQGKVTFRPGEPVNPQAGTRTAMTTPFWGGAAIHGPRGADGDPDAYSVCSSGFSAKSNSNNNYYIITAFHCYNQANPRIYTRSIVAANDKLIGLVSSSNSASDAAFIAVGSGQRSTPFAFTGDLGSITEDNETATVVGYLNPGTVGGIFLCTSGYPLAQRCNVVVQKGVRTWMTTSYDGTRNYPVTGRSGLSSDSDAVTVEGMSGGSVYQYLDTTERTILATGIVSAAGGGIYEVSCPAGSHLGSNPHCSALVYFGLISTLVDQNNIYVAGWA